MSVKRGGLTGMMTAQGWGGLASGEPGASAPAAESRLPPSCAGVGAPPAGEPPKPDAPPRPDPPEPVAPPGNGTPPLPAPPKPLAPPLPGAPPLALLLPPEPPARDAPPSARDPPNPPIG